MNHACVMCVYICNSEKWIVAIGVARGQRGVRNRERGGDTFVMIMLI